MAGCRDAAMNEQNVAVVDQGVGSTGAEANTVVVAAASIVVAVKGRTTQ